MLVDLLMSLFIGALALGFMGLSATLVARLLRSRARLGPAGILHHDEQGVVHIPAFATFFGVKGLWRWMAVAYFNLSPVLKLGPDYLEYRVVLKRRVPLSEIERMEIMTAIGTVNLHLVFKNRLFTLAANLGDEAYAAEVVALINQRRQA